MLASAREPGGDRGVPKAEDPLGSGWVQPFGQCREHHGDLRGRGFQTVQGGVTSSTECGAAGLTPERLDWFGLAMLAIPDERMDLSISIAEVQALLVGTSVPRGIYAFGGSPPAFHLAPGPHRPRRRLSSRRGRGGESTGGAIVWAARLEQTGKPAA